MSRIFGSYASQASCTFCQISSFEKVFHSPASPSFVLSERKKHRSQILRSGLHAGCTMNSMSQPPALAALDGRFSHSSVSLPTWHGALSICTYSLRPHIHGIFFLMAGMIHSSQNVRKPGISRRGLPRVAGLIQSSARSVMSRK